MRLFVHSLFLLFFLLSSACGGSGNEAPNEPDGTGRAVTLRVLSVGNSFSVDALSYLPYVVRSVAPHVHITVGLLNQGGCTLERHWQMIQDGSKYQYYYKAVDDGHWRHPRGDSYNVTLSDVLSEEPWDVIILQQGSAECRDWAHYQPALDNLTTWIGERLDHDATIAWMLIPAFAEGFTRLNGSTSDEMFADIALCSQKVMASGKVQLLLPVGTAIQNARHTSLAQYGVFGGLTYDGMHMNDGIGCLIESYTVAQALFNNGVIAANINNDFSVITQDWLGARWVQQQNGSPVGITEENRAIAKQCVVAALRNPFLISTIE